MDVMAARRQILLNEPHIATATGAIATCVTDMRGLAKECVVQINPVQSGSGDPAPDNVRPISGWTGVTGYKAGVNIFDSATAMIGYKLGSDTGALESNASFCTSDFIPMPSDTITVFLHNVCRGIEARCFFCYDDSKTFITGSSSGLSGGDNRMTSGEKTVVAGTKYIRVVYANTATDVSVNYPATDTAYHPYTGTTIPVTFPAVGKNLLNLSADTFAFCSVPSAISITYLPNNSAELTSTYNFANYVVWDVCEITQSMVGQKVCGTESAVVSFVISETGEWNTRGNSITSPYTITSNDVGKRLGCRTYLYGQETKTLENVMVNFGDSLATFEPYTNTVYGGTVDVVSGELRVTMALQDLGVVEWREDPNRAGVFYGAFDGKRKTGSNIIACSIFRANNVSVTTGTDNYISGKASYSAAAPFFRCSAYAGYSRADVQAALSGQYAAYELATPITYTLTPQQITLLAGTNNLWADTGDTSVKFWKH